MKVTSVQTVGVMCDIDLPSTAILSFRVYLVFYNFRKSNNLIEKPMSQGHLVYQSEYPMSQGHLVYRSEYLIYYVYRSVMSIGLVLLDWFCLIGSVGLVLLDLIFY